MVQSVAEDVLQAVTTTAAAVGGFIVKDPTARKVALLALSYFIGPCALAVAGSYLLMDALGNPDVLSMVGITSPGAKFFAKTVVTAIVAAACLEVVSAGASIAKIAALVGCLWFAAPEISMAIAGTEEKVPASSL